MATKKTGEVVSLGVRGGGGGEKKRVSVVGLHWGLLRRILVKKSGDGGDARSLKLGEIFFYQAERGFSKGVRGNVGVEA